MVLVYPKIPLKAKHTAEPSNGLLLSTAMWSLALSCRMGAPRPAINEQVSPERRFGGGLGSTVARHSQLGGH